MRLTVHTVVKNEDCWIWFALQSVLPFAEQIVVYDTGSVDKTLEIVKAIDSPKIIFEEKGMVNAEGLVKLRQEQLDRTKTDWFLLLDGDEIWPSGQLENLINTTNSSPPETAAVFNRVRNCVGDVFHYLPESAGKYEIKGIKGNLNTRLIKKVPGLRVEGRYPLEDYRDEGGPIQNQASKLVFADVWYLHTSFLKRTSGKEEKVSGSFGRSRVWQKGISINKADLPEVFKLTRPAIVSDPLIKRGLFYEAAALLTSPLIELKRKWR